MKIAQKYRILERKPTYQSFINIVVVLWLDNEYTPYSTHIENTSRGKPFLALGHYYKSLPEALHDFNKRT